MARRVHNDNAYLNSDPYAEECGPYNLDDLSDHDDPYGDEQDYDEEVQQQVPQGGNNEGAEDLINYKGIYFNDDVG